MNIESHYEKVSSITPSPEFASAAHTNTRQLHTQADQDRLAFWKEQAHQLQWFTPFDTVLKWERPFSKWFCNGTLNASVNCLDRHLNTEKAHKEAIIWQGENGDIKRYTYTELAAEVNKIAAMLKTECGVKKGDRVTLYMPPVPQLAMAVLACARIGAIHSVVFAGFSATSLKDRLEDSGSKVLLTADGSYRRGKEVALKTIVDEALESTPHVNKVVVLKHTGANIHWVEGRDIDFDQALSQAPANCEPEHMDSEDPLFILYTSGTTGKPKGILHTTGGYLTHAQYSTKQVFDLKDTDIYWCTADIGWITGHTYLVYGPLLNGATVFMYEGTPDYPDKGVFWKCIQDHKISILYTAPTAIRAFMKWGEQIPAQYDLSSLRLLGSVGEPINPEAWNWYYTHIGGSKCPVVDTWWQTETGGIMITTLPGLDTMKPGFAGKPLPGITAGIFNQDGSKVNQGGGYLSLTTPWPSMARGIWGDNDRFKEVYWSQLDSYFTGDGAIKDEDGYMMVLGRIDDVLNVAGHRIGTMEVESSLVDCQEVAEAAVVGVPDDIKGQAIMAYVILKEGVGENEELKAKLTQAVSVSIGPIAKPKHIVFTPDLPKTRSGKIMRRLLKNIAAGQAIGDTTSLANGGIVELLVEKQKQASLPIPK